MKGLLPTPVSRCLPGLSTSNSEMLTAEFGLFVFNSDILTRGGIVLVFISVILAVAGIVLNFLPSSVEPNVSLPASG